MKESIQQIEQWAEERNLIQGSTPEKQFLKLMEEFGELCGGIAKDKPEIIKDSIGDCFVVLVILNQQLKTEVNIVSIHEEILPLLALTDGEPITSTMIFAARAGELSAYTRDTQTVTTALTISYKLTDPIAVYKNFRTTENMASQLLEPRSRQALEVVFSTYTAQKALENRAQLSTDITSQIRKAVEGYPIEIVSVQSVIQFSKDYEKRVEESVQKNVAIQTAERELIIQQKQAEIVKVNAQAKADAEVIQAKADAEKVRLAGEAEAAAIRAKGEALKENLQLVELTAAEKWNGVLPTTMTPSGAVPFIKVNQ